MALLRNGATLRQNSLGAFDGATLQRCLAAKAVSRKLPPINRTFLSAVLSSLALLCVVCNATPRFFFGGFVKPSV